MKIGIFGGSFNPLHKGHIALADWIIAQGYVEELWLMISPQNPLKQEASLLDEQSRYALAQASLEGHKGVRACNFEFSLPRPSYTWDTLQALEKAYPQHRFSLIIGADNWTIFPRWAHHDEILARYPLLIYPRPGYNVTKLPSSVTYLSEAPLFPVSSTEIRELLSKGLPTNDYLTETTKQLIKQNKWYR